MMILGFQFFHPLNGNCPDTFPEYGADIIVRARNLIKKRSVNELHSIINLINWLIEQSPVKEESESRLQTLFDDLENESQSNEECQTQDSILQRDIDTLTYAVKAFQAKFEIPPNDEVQNLLWSEIFATLALALIDKTIDDENYYKSWAHDKEVHDWMYEWRILSHSSYWLIEAMDAVSTAEGCRNIENQEIATKEKISLRNTKANIERHAKTNRALLAFHQFYDANKHKSMRNAASKFAESYPEILSHLSPDNHLRTLCNGLTAYRNGLRRSLQNS